ncbi:MAG: mandelate racemase/muconate lactonizing enzyme family protein [Kiloniellales bacterium]
MKIAEITLHWLDLPLVTPYSLSYRTFETFEPLLVELRDGDGRRGWGEAHISPGSSSETREGGDALARALAPRLVGQKTAAAKREIAAHLEDSKVAASAFMAAVEMLEGSPLLEAKQETRLALLTAFNATAPQEVPVEVERRLGQGFRTFKIKVGKDVDADLARVAAIQKATEGRASFRIDANRAYSRDDGSRFAQALDPAGIELFEQPCAADDWEANAAVAAVSTVPLMLDEPICDLPDIERAATIPNVGFCKLKLKRFGGPERLASALKKVRAVGLSPVLGDGLGCEVSCWMEACVAHGLVENAGEFNGYLKPKGRLFAEPLPFENGTLILPQGYRPEIDEKKLAAARTQQERFAPNRVAQSA